MNGASAYASRGRGYRYKRPPRKRKAVALDVPAVVRKRGRADAAVPPDRVEDPTPANDDRKPAIVTTTDRKRLKLLRADERAAVEPNDPEEARLDAFLARMLRPGGALPPKKPGKSPTGAATATSWRHHAPRCAPGMAACSLSASRTRWRMPLMPECRVR